MRTLHEAHEGASTLAALRARLAAIEAESDSAPAGLPRLATGAGGLDAALGGGLRCGALHEFHAAQVGDAAAAAGLVAGLAWRAAARTGRPVLWIRTDPAAQETGRLDGAGLRAFGLDPSRALLLQVPGTGEALRAGLEAARCDGLGAAILEIWGAAAPLDLTASRRLGLAAGRSGLAFLMLRAGAPPTERGFGAAQTRWSVRAAPSRPPPDAGFGAPLGQPAFEMRLLRHREGAPGGLWHLEWDHVERAFAERGLSRRSLPELHRHAGAAAPLSGGVAAFSADRPAAAPERRAAG
ncbi:MAG TPA: hypothetical protein VLA00_14090 [Xanthobacteraceae bacterium]|nr:hypothetical protein [Xanthobacteraceae bacterium]